MIKKKIDANKQPGELPRIGNYKLLEEIGKRGNTTIYTAVSEQEPDEHRKIVIRLVYAGKEKKGVSTAFQTLKQSTSILAPGNVAQVYDAGFTDKNYAYFVTEFVQGLPITEYCDKYRLTINERLELFNQVCQLIQQVHYKGLVHLGIRPSNIRIIRENDNEQPVIKILDFGIASALTDQELIENDQHTGCEAGAPFYMSPEQATLSEMDTDNRTDVYALGAVLYELLTGAVPFPGPKDRSEKEETSDFMEIMRQIREEKPRSLLVAFDSHRAGLEKIARMRKTPPVEIKKELQGDLSWIVNKALNKDMENRYNSVSALADDISRYKEKETVIAHPANILYSIQKFIARNPIAVIIAACLVIVGVFFYLRNIAATISAESARKEAVQLKMKADFNTAAALKEKALSAAGENRWPMARFFTAHSILYQARAGKELKMGDIAIPFAFQGWILKYSQAGYSPLFSLSKDGRYLASGNKEGTVKIWQTIDGQVIRELSSEPNATTGLEVINSVSFSPDGKTLAAGGRKILKIWNIETGTEISSFTPVGEKEEIRSISFSPDGSYLVVCGTGDITTWKIPGELNAALKGSAEITGQVSFCPDSRYLATWDSSGTVRVRHLANLEEYKVLPGEGEPVFSTCFSPGGKYLIAGQKNNVLAWDIEGERIVWRSSIEPVKSKSASVHRDADTVPAPVHAVCFSSDGKYLAAGSESGTVAIWELGNPGEAPGFNFVQETCLLKPGSSYAQRLWFHPGGEYLAAGCADRMIRVWELYKTRPAESIVKSTDQSAQQHIQTRAKKVISLINDSGFGRSLDFSPDGKYLAVAGERMVNTWDATTGKTINKIPFDTRDDSISMVRFASDSRQLAISGGNTVKIWDVVDGKEIITLKDGLKGVNAIDFDPRGKYLAASGELAIKIWEIASGEAVAVFQGNIEGLGPIRFSPNGRYLASGDSSGTIKIRDLNTLEIVLTQHRHDGQVTVLCFSPNGKYIASAAARDKDVKIAKVLSPGIHQDLRGHQNEVFSAVFSPSGKYLVSGSKTGTIKIWDTERGTEIATFKGGGYPAVALDFTGNGELLAAGYGQSVKIWDFYYYVNYLYFGLNFPYNLDNVKTIIKKVELETGFILDGIVPKVPMDAYAYYNRGENYLARQDYNKAIAAYRQSLKLAPGSAPAWYELGCALRNRGDFAEAITALQKSIELKAGSPDTWNELGNAYLADKKYDQAITAFQKALQIKPGVSRVLYDLGLAYDKKGDNPKAIEYFTKAATAAPKFAAARYRLGLVFDRIEDFEKAVKAFDEALYLAPGDKDAWNHLGITLTKMQEYERSIQAFQRAVEIDPEFAGAWNNMGITYRNLGNYEKAVELHTRAVKVNPAYDLAWDALGNTYNLKKDYKKAISSYKKAIAINAVSWRSYGNLGFIYVKQEQPEKAIEAFEETVKINPKFFPAWNSLGALYARKADYEKSVEAYREAVTLKPREHEVRNNLGKSYYLKGDFDDAMAQFKEAVAIENRNLSAHFNIALTMLAQKRFESAHNYYIKVMEQMKPDKSYIAAAIVDIDNLLQENPEYNFAYLVRRYLYNQAGDKDKAREDLERFIGFIKSSKGD